MELKAHVYAPSDEESVTDVVNEAFNIQKFANFNLDDGEPDEYTYMYLSAISRIYPQPLLQSSRAFELDLESMFDVLGPIEISRYTLTIDLPEYGERWRMLYMSDAFSDMQGVEIELLVDENTPEDQLGCFLIFGDGVHELWVTGGIERDHIRALYTVDNASEQDWAELDASYLEIIQDIVDSYDPSTDDTGYFGMLALQAFHDARGDGELRDKIIEILTDNTIVEDVGQHYYIGKDIGGSDMYLDVEDDLVEALMEFFGDDSDDANEAASTLARELIENLAQPIADLRERSFIKENAEYHWDKISHVRDLSSIAEAVEDISANPKVYVLELDFEISSSLELVLRPMELLNRGALKITDEHLYM